MKWHKALGTPEESLRFHDHEKLAFYADAATDIEYRFPFGFKEVEGIHSRTDYDLTQHETFSKKKQRYHDPELKESYVPYVIETSIGADRLFLLTLCNAFKKETVGEGDKQKERVYMKFHPAVAPVKAAIFPLVKKDGLPDVAKKIKEELKYDFNVVYEEAGNIGKRYVRQDLIGTPFCIVVDHDTLEDNSVTVRFRDTMEQQRMPISALASFLEKEVSFKRVFEAL